MSESLEKYAAVVVGTCLLSSLLVLLYLFRKHIGGRPLLEYERRQRVPWGPFWATAAVLMTAIAVAEQLFAVQQLKEAPQPQEIIVAGWTNLVVLLLLVLVAIGCLVRFVRADARDLGLPLSFQQSLRDVGLGVLACVASFAPVFLMQVVLVNISQSETQHPLVQKLMESYSPELLWMSWAAAVVVAPVFEEFTFRLLLQGWLERREDQVLGFAATEREPVILVHDEHAEMLTPTVLLEVSDEEAISPAPPPWDGTRPPRGWIKSLPYGWTPMLISSVLFGLAHFGHGVSPVPLVLLGIVLGYLYQRTHRLLPCIVAHMMFNAYSMSLLTMHLNGGE